MDKEQHEHCSTLMFALQQETARQEIALNELNGQPSFGVGIDYIWVNDRTDINFLDNGRDILQLKELAG